MSTNYKQIEQRKNKAKLQFVNCKPTDTFNATYITFIVGK